MTTMKVSTRRWHARAYRWWATHPSTIRRLPRTPNPDRSSLCPYVRVVAFHAPLLWLGTHRFRHGPRWFRPWQAVALLWWVTMLLVGLARWRTGTIEFLFAFGVGIGATTLTFCCLGLAVWGSRQRSGFIHLLWEFARACKHRVCPIIEVVDDMDLSEMGR